VVQIAHGLGEHMGRYAELAETLLEDELAVYGNDHRGHGLTAKPSGSFGDFRPGGFDQLVEDMVSLRVVAKDEHPGKELGRIDLILASPECTSRKTEKLKLRMAIMPEIETRFSVAADQVGEAEGSRSA